MFCCCSLKDILNRAVSFAIFYSVIYAFISKLLCEESNISFQYIVYGNFPNLNFLRDSFVLLGVSPLLFFLSVLPSFAPQVCVGLGEVLCLTVFCIT